MNFFSFSVVQIPKIVSVNITHITTTHALFTWKRIKDNNKTYGVVAGYKVSFTHNQRPGIELDVSSFESEVQLNDLLPNTSYGVIVFGYNHYGDGAISDVYNFTTKGTFIAGNLQRGYLFWFAIDMYVHNRRCCDIDIALLKRLFSYFLYANTKM